MKRNLLSLCAAPQGRPREVTLTPGQEVRYAQLVLLANKDRKSGSASMAWRMLCDEFPEIPWDWRELASKHQIPAVAREVARRAQALVSLHRQGERGLRSTGAYTPGMLRRQWDGKSRRLAGEHGSWDDATVNFGVLIPWEHGGCKLSDKYKVKLGRFQLLLNHDEASSFVPAWSHVIRESQGYRGTDVVEAVMRVSRDVALYKALVLEGGVWQGQRMKRVMDSLGVELLSVKGRPQCKMVENFFNRLWTRLGMEKGLASVGRFRGEEKANSEFYVKCRAGNADPRGKFPHLHEAVEGMERAVRWLNADRIESPTYGKWVPEERWAADLLAHPRPVISGEALWLAAPCMEKRMVSRNGVIATATGPLGLRMRYHFTGPCLWEWEGKQVEIYFDPLAAWPITAVCCLPGKTTPLGKLDCANPYADGGQGAEVARSLREVMRREYRYLWSGGEHLAKSARESTLRGTEGVVEVRSAECGTRNEENFSRSGTDQPAEREKNQRGHTPAVPDLPFTRAAAEVHGEVSRKGSLLEGVLALSVDTLSGRNGKNGNPGKDELLSLGRRAAAAREAVPNW